MPFFDSHLNFAAPNMNSSDTSAFSQGICSAEEPLKEWHEMQNKDFTVNLQSKLSYRWDVLDKQGISNETPISS